MANTTKVFRSSNTAKAGIMVRDEAAFVIGNDNNFIVVDNRGITMRGAESHVCMSNDIRQGGLWTQQPDFIRMLPSTIASPLPAQMITPPVVGLKDVAITVAFFAAMLVYAGV